MSVYHAALYEFVTEATPETIAAIREMAKRQEKTEKSWFEARKEVPESQLTAFDTSLYETLHEMNKEFSHTLKELGVPLFEDGSKDPRARQKLLALLGDLAAYPPQSGGGRV